MGYSGLVSSEHNCSLHHKLEIAIPDGSYVRSIAGTLPTARLEGGVSSQLPVSRAGQNPGPD
jgi:hypothetical protein